MQPPLQSSRRATDFSRDGSACESPCLASFLRALPTPKIDAECNKLACDMRTLRSGQCFVMRSDLPETARGGRTGTKGAGGTGSHCNSPGPQGEGAIVLSSLPSSVGEMTESDSATFPPPSAAVQTVHTIPCDPFNSLLPQLAGQGNEIQPREGCLDASR